MQETVPEQDNQSIDQHTPDTNYHDSDSSHQADHNTGIHKTIAISTVMLVILLFGGILLFSNTISPFRKIQIDSEANYGPFAIYPSSTITPTPQTIDQTIGEVTSSMDEANQDIDAVDVADNP